MRCHVLIHVTCMFGLFAAPLAAAQDARAPAPPAPPATPAPSTAELPPADDLGPPSPMLEGARTQVRAGTTWLARSIDSWFGSQPFEEGGKVSDGRLSLGFLKRQDQNVDIDVRFNVQARLPNVEKFAYVFIGRDDRRDVLADTPDAFARQNRLLRERDEDPAFVAGLGLDLPNNVSVRLGMRGGFKPYVQARYSLDWTWDSGTQVAFRETVFWARSDRFGSTTALSLEQPLSPSLSVRWLGAATVTQEAPKFAWSSVLGGYQSFGSQRLLSLELLTDGTQGSAVDVSDWGLQVKWAQPVYREWLLLEVVGGHFWPRPDAAQARGRAWAAGASLRMTF